MPNQVVEFGYMGYEIRGEKCVSQVTEDTKDLVSFIIFSMNYVLNYLFM